MQNVIRFVAVVYCALLDAAQETTAAAQVITECYSYSHTFAEFNINVH